MSITLSFLTRPQGNNRALIDGDVQPEGFRLAHADVPVLVDGFRRMVRGLEFEVAEMAATTYLCAKEHGVRFTALPIFLVRDFHHSAILINKRAVAAGHDLEGQRVGVNRGYTVTSGVWARAIMSEEAGVDLDKVTWVLSGDEHVQQFRPPPNVIASSSDRTLSEALIEGDLAATIGVEVEHEDIAPLFAADAGMAALRARGFYPINHLVVVRDDVLAAHPEVATSLMRAFTQAKDHYVRRLLDGEIDTLDATDKRYLAVAEATGADPLPYGLSANRATLEHLLDTALQQRVLTVEPELDTLFAEATRES